MFDHVTIRASDRAASERFYELVLEPLGIARTYGGQSFAEWDDFSLAQASDDRPATRRLHIAFVAPTRAHCDAFWESGVAAGYRDDGVPGPRPIYGEDYYGAFLLDPDGNSAEAVHHGTLRRGGVVDHLWIRVADVAAGAGFYELVAGFAGFRRREDITDGVRFSGASGTFSLLDDGPPTENLHLAFGAAEDATVDAFHAAAMAAGHRDAGSPGERPIYHPGYYGAYVLDPDGNSVELVAHNRV